MKRETIEKAIGIIRTIDHLEYLIKDLEKSKKDYHERGYLKVDSGSFDKIEIPFQVFALWYDDQIDLHLKKISELNKELDEL